MKFFKKLQFEDSAVARFQDNVEDAVDQITRKPIIDGVLVENISLAAGVDNAVSHKLGRKPVMWIEARKFGNATIWEIENTATATLLVLRSSANVTLSLWVA